MLDLDSLPEAQSVETRVQSARALLLRGVRQAAILRATSAAITHAPTLDDCASAIERARDALSQFEETSERYCALTSGELLADTQQVSAGRPVPRNWQEAVLAQWLLCAATRVELEREREQAQPPGETENTQSVQTRAELASTLEHMSAARAALQESGAFSPEGRASLLDGSSEWLKLALATLADDEARATYQRVLNSAVAPDLGLLPH
jgi:hypothetical protein